MPPKTIPFTKAPPPKTIPFNTLPTKNSTAQDIIAGHEVGQSYLDRIGSSFKNAGESIVKGVEKGADVLQHNDGSFKGTIGAAGELLKTGLHTAGEVAGEAFTPIIEAPLIKPAIEQLRELALKVPGVKDLADKAKELAAKHPESAQAILDMVNIATVGTGKTIEKPLADISGKAIEKAGQVIEKSGVNAIDSQETNFLRDLIRPEQTKAIKESQVGRTTEEGIGPFKRSVIEPTPAELKAEQAVATIPEVSSKNTFQQNYNIIADANKKEAINLEKQISENDFIIPRKETKARLEQAKVNLAESPLITGDAEKTAEKLLAKANQLVDQNSGTGSGLLKARKDYDSWVRLQKPKAFDATAENAFTIANREVRNTFNTLLDEKATNVGVKESLSKQSSLYTALDNIRPKAAVEADTAIGRAFDNMAKAVGIKNKLVQQIATVAGIGGLGAAATFAPGVAIGGGLGFLGYQGAKLVLKPQVRIALGKLLKTSGQLLQADDREILERAIIQSQADGL